MDKNLKFILLRLSVCIWVRNEYPIVGLVALQGKVWIGKSNDVIWIQWWILHKQWTRRYTNHTVHQKWKRILRPDTRRGWHLTWRIQTRIRKTEEGVLSSFVKHRSQFHTSLRFWTLSRGRTCFFFHLGKSELYINGAIQGARGCRWNKFVIIKSFLQQDFSTFSHSPISKPTISSLN